jgi:hypothetical protein
MRDRVVVEADELPEDDHVAVAFEAAGTNALSLLDVRPVPGA